MSYLVEFVYNTAHTYSHRVFLLLSPAEYDKYMNYRDLTDHTGYPLLVLTHDVLSDDGYHPMPCRYVSATLLSQSCAQSIRDQVHNKDLYTTFVETMKRLGK